MRGSIQAVATGKQQVPYARKRDHPHFHRVTRTDSAPLVPRRDHEPVDATDRSISRSLSDIWEFESRFSVPSTKTSISVESERSNFDKEIELVVEAPLGHDEENKGTSSGSKKNIITNHQTSLPQCAASFYGGDQLQTEVSVLGLCKSVHKLNGYLKARKDDIKAGVPGQYVHAVISEDSSDVGSFVCTIAYAFLLNETQNESQLCTIPVINMKHVDFSSHAELRWLVSSCQIDESNLIFIDEIDLSYYDQFGNLKLVLLNGHKLPSKHEGLKEAVVEIFGCKEVDSCYPSIKEITLSKDHSCSTLVAEKFAETWPEILAGKGFCRLLLSGILLDTANLTTANCTSKDKYMATLLIRGAGRYGCYGLYQILKHKMHDISDLKVKEILRREFKKWTRISGKPNSISSRLTVSYIGMSSIGISIEQLLGHEDSAAEEIILFQGLEKLRLFMIVSGYYDGQKNFKREILVSTNTAELMKSFLEFFDTNGAHLPLKSLGQLDQREEFRAFEIDNKLTSRRSIERLLEDFGGVLRQSKA